MTTTTTRPNPAIGALFDRLKAEIDLHDLAEHLGLKRKGNRGNYHSPHHPDKTPSLSILPNRRGWKDHSSDQGGSCIDLVLYCRPDLTTAIEAARLLCELYAIAFPNHTPTPASEPKSNEEYIADKCLQAPEPVVDYLASRGIDEAVSRAAIKNRSLGWNTWHNPKIPAGEAGHGGPAAAFIVRSLDSRRVVAVDARYADSALNGGSKSQCRGAKQGHGWTSSLTRLRQAKTVYLVESPINALSIECAFQSDHIAAFAIRGTGNAQEIDLAFLNGKRVLIALDHTDPINERSGQRPGLAAAWHLSERLTAANIAHQLVDMQDWQEGEDINDVLQKHGAPELAKRLKHLETWLIPGMPGGGERLAGSRRVFLPDQDFKVYWRYRVREDFTQYVDEFKDDDDGRRQESFADLCSFRVAGFSRLRLQGHLATINGTPDSQTETVIGVSAQIARHAKEIQRKVIDDRSLYKLEEWECFGAIFKPQQFKRMVNILERAAHLGARDVVNFIGLAWRDGSLTALEGSDCYFREPEKQCRYHNMSFPRGNPQAARVVISAYQATFQENAAAIALVWGLGSHLKAILGYYPHFQMQAEKGAGKSKLLESMQATLAFQVLSGQMLKTDHRRRSSVSYTSHPVGWDEFSKLPKAVLSEIDGMLQSTYRFEYTQTGTALLPFLMCAPVLLAGEEVDVISLQSKLCRSSLTSAKQGAMIPDELPQFPVWQWLKFLENIPASEIRKHHHQRLGYCQENSRADPKDTTARRMLENYAAILTTWDYLCRFADIATGQGGFEQDLIREMNTHIEETNGSRRPWVWIMDILLSEIDARRFEHPYCWGTWRLEDGSVEQAIFLRPKHVMDHLATANHLRNQFDALPVKTPRVFTQQLEAAGVVMTNDADKLINGIRNGHLSAISLPRLERFGLHASPDFNRTGAAYLAA